jgi:anti-anti-sigma factor
MSSSDRGRHDKAFETQAQVRGKTVHLLLAGEFDLAAKEEFEQRLREALSPGPEAVVLDLRQVKFMDSTGLRLVVEAWNLSRQRGFGFTVLPASGAVARLFEQTGLDQTLPISGRALPDFS